MLRINITGLGGLQRKVREKMEIIKCSECGEFNQQGLENCSNCGAALMLKTFWDLNGDGVVEFDDVIEAGMNLADVYCLKIKKLYDYAG